ncbi:MAG: RnfABCDGE type electron transport complex subunit A, partial [Bacteroidales bacterium]|nr:RnfABCDGE type electron transport complex subunit A [Bacteroidales bacterium]
MEYLTIIIFTVFVSNIILTQFLGLCPFLGLSTKISTALGMGAAVIFVMALSTLVTFLVDDLILIPLGVGFLRTIAFILIIAALVQMLEIILKKVSPSLYQALGVFLPLITTNCAVLGIAIVAADKGLGLLWGLVYTVGIAVGFTVAITLFASIREHIELMGVPKGMKGMPIALITAGILAMAFMGFGGLV